MCRSRVEKKSFFKSLVSQGPNPRYFKVLVVLRGLCLSGPKFSIGTLSDLFNKCVNCRCSESKEEKVYHCFYGRSVSNSYTLFILLRTLREPCPGHMLYVK